MTFHRLEETNRVQCNNYEAKMGNERSEDELMLALDNISDCFDLLN